MSLGRDLTGLSLRRHTYGLLAECLMHMAHKIGIGKSDWLNSTGFPRDVCVTFLNSPPGNKDAVTLNPFMEETCHCVYNCENEHLSGSTKCKSM